MRSNTRIGLGATILAGAALAACLAGCGPESGVSGTADQTFTVSGPVRLEVVNGSGDSRVIAGPPGEVRIHAQFRVFAWPWEDAQRKLQEIEANPPFSQSNNLIRVGSPGWDWNDFVADYTVTVPADAEVRAVAGSGNIDVNGIHGPANFVVGSGNIAASGISDDIHATVGSGRVRLADVQGRVQVLAGSGDVDVDSAKGEVRVRSGSGNIQIERPSDSVVGDTGSGNLRITGAAADIRLHTGSGDITVDGSPGAASYWDLRASSGDVRLRVPSDASLRFYARTGSGDIDLGIPGATEEHGEKHEVRARVGDGKARVEVQTSSGDISLH